MLPCVARLSDVALALEDAEIGRILSSGAILMPVRLLTAKSGAGAAFTVALSLRCPGTD